MIVRISEQNKLIVLLQSKQEYIVGGVGWGVGGVKSTFFDAEKLDEVLNVEEGVEGSHRIGPQTERARVPVAPSSRAL